MQHVILFKTKYHLTFPCTNLFRCLWNVLISLYLGQKPTKWQQKYTDAWQLTRKVCQSKYTVPDVHKPPSGQSGHVSRSWILQTLTALWTRSCLGRRKFAPRNRQAAMISTNSWGWNKCLHSNNFWKWTKNYLFLLPASCPFFSFLTCFIPLRALPAGHTSCPAGDGSTVTPEKNWTEQAVTANRWLCRHKQRLLNYLLLSSLLETNTWM